MPPEHELARPERGRRDGEADDGIREHDLAERLRPVPEQRRAECAGHERHERLDDAHEVMTVEEEAHGRNLARRRAGGYPALLPASFVRMKIYSWNVNGLRGILRKGLFQSFIAEHEPDVLCLQETKAEREQVEVDLAGYHEYWNSAVRKGYAGTALFSKAKPVSVRNGLPAALAKRYKLKDKHGDACNDEGRVITAEFAKLYVVTVYTPNAKDDLSRLPLRQKHWDPAFLAYCKQLEKKKPVVFCGDLNVAHTELDLANPKSNKGRKGFTVEERAGFQAYLDAGFVDTLRLFREGNGHYTWWSHFANARARNVGWRIDYMLVSDALRKAVKKADIHADVMGSDHCPVSITLGPGFKR